MRAILMSRATKPILICDDDQGMRDTLPAILKRDYRVLTVSSDRIVAEHYGYRRLKNPVIHRRTVTFNKPERSWLMEDELLGDAVDHDLGDVRLALRGAGNGQFVVHASFLPDSPRFLPADGVTSIAMILNALQVPAPIATLGGHGAGVGSRAGAPANL